MEVPAQPPTHYCVFDVNDQSLGAPKPVPWKAAQLALKAEWYTAGGLELPEYWPRTWAQALDMGWKLCGLVPGTVVDQEDICAHYAGNKDGPGVCTECEMAP